jgi:transposase
MMALRESNRYQSNLLPPSVDEYVCDSDSVRAYDAFISALNLEELGLVVDRNKVGCPAYDPIAMLKLLVYGYSYGVRSSRKLEQATHHNLSFIWLTGHLQPDHKTIARFRKNNLETLQQVLKLTARMCLKLNLIEGHTLFIDGTKLRGNCGNSRHLTQKGADRLLVKLDAQIEKLLKECDEIDVAEAGSHSHQELTEQLRDREAIRDEVQSCVEEMREKGLTSINRTDREAVLFKSRQGSHAGYNVQSSVDEANGLVVAIDVVNALNDRGQIEEQVLHAECTLEREVKTVCADAGYEHVDKQEPLVRRGIELIVPSQRQVKEKPLDEFDYRQFDYDSECDVYRCPMGQELAYSTIDKANQKRVYRAKKTCCLTCCHFGRCTTSKTGRVIKRHPHQVTKEQLESLYESDRGQEIYRQRGLKVELPYGHVKHNLAVTGFLLRGIEATKAEASLMFTAFNIKRMINLLGGVESFCDKMRGLATI